MRDSAKQTATMPTTRYTVKQAELGRDRATVLALWQQAFPGSDQHPIKYDWCYGATPQGPGRLYLLEYADEGCVIGVQGIVPRRWWVQGGVRPAGICSDLVVDQNHRSIGPALALVRQVIAMERQGDDACLLYGFPNPKSEALYRRAGYNKMGEIIRYALPLRVHVWLARKGIPKPLATALGKFADLAFQARLALNNLRSARRWRCVPVTQFDTRFDALWSRVAEHAVPMVIRDSDYLRWRFGNNFSGQTQVMVLETHDGQIDGYVVYVVQDNKLVSVLDFLAADQDVALPVLFRLFARAMYRQGVAGVMLEYSGPSMIAACLRQCGFSARETNPIYAVLGHKAVGWQDGVEPYFTYSDRDQ